MAELESSRERIVRMIKKIVTYNINTEGEGIIYFDGTSLYTQGKYVSLSEYLDTKTNQELVELVNTIEKLNYPGTTAEKRDRIYHTVNHFENKNSFIELKKEIANIKDHMQNTTDIVNLFTDIDKNRTNLEDKVNNLETKINNIESSLGQILALLQKS